MTALSPHSPSRIARPWLRIALGGLTAFGLLAAAYLAGPVNSLGPTIPTQRALPPTDIGALETWIKSSEAHYTDIRPGNAKGIVWATPSKQRTTWAVVYLHGFTASRLETAPLADEVARALGANAFHTRLTGHGRTSGAMAEASAQDWMADTLEAVRIGHTLGKQVLLISCSTGSTLATWLALTPEGKAVSAHVFISPNFGLKDKRSDLINGPWGQQLARALEGETRGWHAEDPRETNVWTTQYPTRALYPMMALVKTVRESNLTHFETPVLMLYSEQDQSVEARDTRDAFARIGTPYKTIQAVGYSQAKGQHVLAGAIRDPQAVAPMVSSIVKWAKTVPHAVPNNRHRDNPETDTPLK